jgi:N-acetylmuramoyl-L-alanine amidase
MSKLQNKQIALVVGHERGGGAAGERSYNLALAIIMRDILEERCAAVYVHKHHEKSYGVRQDEMRAAVKEALPDCACCIELHYNSYESPNAQGHEFFYRGCKRIAECFRDRFQEDFPWSRGRQSNGIMKQITGNGSGFLRKAPAWACLVEPFFESNAKEREYFMGHQAKLATSYCNAIEDFLT